MRIVMWIMNFLGKTEETYYLPHQAYSIKIDPCQIPKNMIIRFAKNYLCFCLPFCGFGGLHKQTQMGFIFINLFSPTMFLRYFYRRITGQVKNFDEYLNYFLPFLLAHEVRHTTQSSFWTKTAYFVLIIVISFFLTIKAYLPELKWILTMILLILLYWFHPVEIDARQFAHKHRQEFKNFITCERL